MNKTMNPHTAPQALPGPRFAFWGLACLSPMRKDYLGFVGQVQKQHPDLAAWRVGWEQVVHVFHPEWARELLVDQAEHWVRWERVTETFAQSMGQSVLVTEGAQWQRQRRMLQAGFSPKRVAGYTGHMVQACAQALERMSGANPLALHDMQALMTGITIDVIVRALFGQARQMDAMQVSAAIHELSSEGFAQLFRLRNRPMWWPVPSMRRARHARDVLNAVIAQQISERRQSLAQEAATDSPPQDILTMLLQARDPQQPEQGLSAQEVHDQTMVIFQAGHETSAMAMTWWAGLVARHPAVQKRLHAEVDDVLQGQAPTPERLAQMLYLQATLKEAMRLYPSAATLMTRRLQRPVRCGPWTLPQGALVYVSPALIHRDARWFEAPDQFMPERFMPGAQEIPRGAWLPFGTGPRVCLGQHFAMLEMGVIAAMLLQRHRLAWPLGEVWPEAEMTLTLRPRHPIRLHVQPRMRAG